MSEQDDPLVQGGQGRSDSNCVQAAIIVGICAALAFLLVMAALVFNQGK